MEYPIVSSYRYLGTVLPNYLSINNHVESLNLKATYITYRLTSFRLHASFKFNTNFFKLLVAPQYRLLAALWDHVSPSAQNSIAASYRSRFKCFALLPRSTPTVLI